MLRVDRSKSRKEVLAKIKSGLFIDSLIVAAREKRIELFLSEKSITRSSYDGVSSTLVQVGFSEDQAEAIILSTPLSLMDDIYRWVSWATSTVNDIIIKYCVGDNVSSSDKINVDAAFVNVAAIMSADGGLNNIYILNNYLPFFAGIGFSFIQIMDMLSTSNGGDKALYVARYCNMWKKVISPQQVVMLVKRISSTESLYFLLDNLNLLLKKGFSVKCLLAKALVYDDAGMSSFIREADGCLRVANQKNMAKIPDQAFLNRELKLLDLGFNFIQADRILLKLNSLREVRFDVFNNGYNYFCRGLSYYKHKINKHDIFCNFFAARGFSDIVLLPSYLRAFLELNMSKEDFALIAGDSKVDLGSATFKKYAKSILATCVNKTVFVKIVIKSEPDRYLDNLKLIYKLPPELLRGSFFNEGIGKLLNKDVILHDELITFVEKLKVRDGKGKRISGSAGLTVLSQRSARSPAAGYEHSAKCGKSMAV